MSDDAARKLARAEAHLAGDWCDYLFTKGSVIAGGETYEVSCDDDEEGAYTLQRASDGALFELDVSVALIPREAVKRRA